MATEPETAQPTDSETETAPTAATEHETAPFTTKSTQDMATDRGGGSSLQVVWLKGESRIADRAWTKGCSD